MSTTLYRKTFVQGRNLLLGSILATAAAFTAVPAAAQTEDPGNFPPRLCAVLALLGHTPASECDDHAAEFSPEVEGQLQDLLLSVLPFFNFDVAVAAGWDTIPGGECVESPMGGMGYHLQNIDQLVNGQLNLLRPEALLYAPTEDGSLQFVGVEFIIPGDLWDHPDPPVFLEQSLHFNPNVGAFGIWALHVWVVEDNPDGMFADWNPEVSCEFAPEA